MSIALQVLIAAYILFRKSIDGAKEITPEDWAKRATWQVFAKAAYIAVLSVLCVGAGWSVIVGALTGSLTP